MYFWYIEFWKLNKLKQWKSGKLNVKYNYSRQYKLLQNGEKIIKQKAQKS